FRLGFDFDLAGFVFNRSYFKFRPGFDFDLAGFVMISLPGLVLDDLKKEKLWILLNSAMRVRQTGRMLHNPV
ncbi:MAG: hypothetical protein ABFS56_35110, partial [Pseudomonadota bacterium]